MHGTPSKTAKALSLGVLTVFINLFSTHDIVDGYQNATNVTAKSICLFPFGNIKEATEEFNVVVSNSFSGILECLFDLSNSFFRLLIY